MNNEIKEIIQLIGNCCYRGEISEDKCEKYCNCITNLQEELKSANESISWWQNRFNAVEKENKRLKEELEITQEKWDKDKQWVECRTKEWLDYKTRNEKAIEYMNNYIEVEDAPINERIKTEFKEVIRLLTGGDK